MSLLSLWNPCSLGYFAMMINEALKGLDFCFTSLNDIVIFSKLECEHLDHLCQVYDCLYEANIQLELSNFPKSQPHYLRHLLSQEGILPLPEQSDAIRLMAPPENSKEFKQFPGLSGYFRDHINHYEDIILPLIRLLKKDAPYLWIKNH